MKQIDKILATILIVMALGMFSLALGWGVWKKYFDPKISWSNYHIEQKKED